MNDSQPDTVKFQTLQDACQLAKPFYYCAVGEWGGELRGSRLEA